MLLSGEELEVLVEQQTWAASKTKKTSNKQEGNFIASSKVNTATVNKAGAHGFLAINSSSRDATGSTKSGRKSEHINAAHYSLQISPNPITVFTVPCPRARFLAIHCFWVHVDIKIISTLARKTMKALLILFLDPKEGPKMGHLWIPKPGRASLLYSWCFPCLISVVKSCLRQCQKLII